ncbi:MAG: Rne/Rng family ribonuclease [Gloeomargarita sp. SKYBB_i_bin120]|nr:Rne/Rng family ribonuclease [Gloeomargarita sp. SKYB120]MDW8177525.1 Rne/Rng family ribonuclease [Gloeomargarita sp. SKYBB_i_bin120]
MSKQIILAEQHRIAAVFADDQIQELVVATGHLQVGDIFLGVVENVLPGIDAAFVNIGDPERNGFIHVSDLGPLRLKKTAGAITELLMPQQKVLVQVMKEPTGNKGPRLTGNITLPGRYLVLMPYGRGVFLSQRIQNENERHRLRALAVLIKPPQMGLLVRTEAEGVNEEAIMEDLESLKRQWEKIQRDAANARGPGLLSRDDDFIQRVLRDFYSAQVNRIVTDTAEGVKRVKQQLSAWCGGKLPPGLLVDHHREPIPILEYFRVNAAIREALKPRVDLPKGGYIVIEPTEALTVIDVNSGSFTRSATSRETVLWTNYEAATEIARQLRLRNIGGVIIVDFIDMEDRRDQLQLLEHFSKVLKNDKARPQIVHLSDLGLVELTRKRQGQSIYELFGQPCPHCNGLGHLVRLPGQTTAETITPSIPRPAVTSERPESVEELGFAPSPNPELGYTTPLYPVVPLGSSERPSSSNNRRRHRRYEKPAPRVTEPEPPPFATPNPTPPTTTSNGTREQHLRRRPPKPTPPATQVVTVGMTPEEQTVYAEMGVSPLVLTGQTHLQDVVVEVRLPEEVAAMKAEAPSEPAVSETETPPPEPTPAPATSAVATETATPETPPVTDTRRRRRRSTTLTLAESPTASE